jgi:energy-coupling factor transporter ATP-binding protein EcfA2
LRGRFALATILVSHDIGEIFRLSRRVLCLEDGRIGRQGRPDEAPPAAISGRIYPWTRPPRFGRSYWTDKFRIVALVSLGESKLLTCRP